MTAPASVKFQLPLAVLAALAMVSSIVAKGLAPSRPMIWVTPTDRAEILAKIESHSWARVSFDAMKDRVREAVADHTRDPDAFLRGFATDTGGRVGVPAAVSFELVNL